MAPIKPKLVVLVTPGFVLNALFRNWFEKLSKTFEIETISNSENLNIDDLQRWGVKCNILPISRKPALIKDIKATLKLFELVKERKDSVFFTSTLKISFLLALISFFVKINFVYLIRGLPYENKSFLMKALYKFIERIIIKKSFKTGIISMYLKNYLVNELLIDSSKIYIIGRGSSNGIAHNNLVKERDEFDFCYSGRICNDKGIWELLSAFNEHRSKYKSTLLLVGKLEDSIGVDQVVGEGITYKGWVKEPTTEIIKAKIFIYPSKREGFGNAPLEAASVGVPSIITNIPGLNETVINEVTGLVCKADCSDLFEKMERLYLENSLRHTFGQNASAYVKKEFSQNLFFKAYKNLFLDMFGDS